MRRVVQATRIRTFSPQHKPTSFSWWLFSESLKGKAEISAMSPNEFWLKLEALDSKGHIGVKFSLGKSMHTDNGQFENQMFGGFEVEPGAVKSLYEWLTDIISKNIGRPSS